MLQIRAPLLEDLLDPLVKTSPEQLLEDLLLFRRICVKQIAELALRQDDHLPELLTREAEEALNLRRDVADLSQPVSKDLPAGIDLGKLDLVLLLPATRANDLRGLTPHKVVPPAYVKDELDFADCFGLCALRPHESGVPR